jgi:biofilm PGA synthesis protein PgaD
MNQPLIFTERRPLPRVLDTLLTLIAWFGFSYLIYNGLMTALAHSPFLGIRPFFSTLDTVTIYAVIGMLNGLVLIAWAKYNQRRFRGVERRSRRPGLKENELAASLHITSGLAMELNKGRVLTVYHHDNGEIDRVEVSRNIIDNLLPPPAGQQLMNYFNNVSANQPVLY